jgi:hypothetical protein
VPTKYGRISSSTCICASNNCTRSARGIPCISTQACIGARCNHVPSPRSPSSAPGP